MRFGLLGRGKMFGKDKQQQRDLFESERSFRLLVENVADYALYMLDPTGIVTSWNIGGQRIKGYSPEEIVGQHFSRFYTETDRANGKPARALQIAREQGRYEEEGWRVRKDGTFFWASVVIDPIREGDTLVGFAKITRDITERREAQLKFEQMQAAAGGIAKARRAGPAHRRRGARFQQSSHDHQRQSSHVEARHRRQSQGPARADSDRGRRQARRRPDRPVADICAASKRQSGTDQCRRTDRCGARGARNRRRRCGGAAV